MAIKSRLQRKFLYCFIGCISLCALIGIYCLLFQQFNDLIGRILMTTGAVGLSAMLAMASATAWERKKWHPLGIASMATVFIALLLVLLAIWLFLDSRNEIFLKSLVSVSALAFILATISQVAVVRLKRNFEWVRLSWTVIACALATMIIISIFLEMRSDPWYRSLGAVAILFVCGAISITILQRISRLRNDEQLTFELSSHIQLSCPRCHQMQQFPINGTKCQYCDLKISIQIEENNCPACGYSLYQVEGDACPECGEPI